MYMYFEKCLNKLLESSKIIYFDENSRIILFSDCHRGDGSWADDFAANENLYNFALRFYNRNRYTYIEVGDGDELWENRFNDIWEAHSNIFDILQKFHDPDPEKTRFFLIHGNHDMERKYPEYVHNTLDISYKRHYDRDTTEKPLFFNITIHEGLLLQHRKKNIRFLVIHGHQGDLLCDLLWRFSKILVRFIWKPLQQISGFKDPTRPASHHKKQDKIDHSVKKWIVSHRNQPIIMGHTHRPWFARDDEPPYYNTGSCVHPRCITGIEIVDDSISLIKWAVTADEKGALSVKKEVLEGKRL